MQLSPSARPSVPILAWTAGLIALCTAFAGPLRAIPQEIDLELEELLAEAREEADTLRRRGEWSAARRDLEELLDEEPSDWATRAYLARLALEEGDYDACAGELARTFRDAAAASPEGRALGQAREALRVAHWTELERLAELGRGDAAIEAEARARAGGFAVGDSARIDEAAARALLAAGHRDEALALLHAAAEFRADDALDAGRVPEQVVWQEHLATARALRALDELEEASLAVVAAARASAGRGEPEALAELASLYFEADGEVADARTASRNPGPLFREALAANPRCEAALLGLFELHRFNWRRQSRQADAYLDDLFAVRPDSIGGRLAAASSAVDLGRLREAREHLDRLRDLAPERREVRTLEATLAWIEHGRDEARAILDELAASDPLDATPERTVGEHLVELYRFAEALPFLEAAVERDERDHEAWAVLGRARGNTGDVPGAREALERARLESAGRRNLVRQNLAMVLERIDEQHVVSDHGELSFAWPPGGRELLELYWLPFYKDARADLAVRYGYTPGPTRIEVFDRHGDFSVRSTGFEGFPALGVCFGPVVTAVSPLSELRGSFSWARTAYHEFTHVVHLGLSNNRCPRWITEGLATWEETRANPAWDRNMRRDLLDARANGQIIPLRELNAAFRGPRVVFGYYQGGLICRVLIAEFGFPSMIRLLEAFDRGADLDRALDEVFGLTPEQVDERLAQEIERELAGLAIEPNWDPDRVAVLALGLERELPEDPEQAARWRDDWCTVAMAAAQDQRRVDAEEALRLAELGGASPPRALALRGRLAYVAGDRDRALELWRAFLDAGGEDFQVRMALADQAFEAGDVDEAEAQLLAAEAAFPGFADPGLSAELALARLYGDQGRTEDAMAARERWLAYNADDLGVRLEVARWHQLEGRHERAAELFRQANEVDPFFRRLHVDWATSLLELGGFDEAVREAHAARLVPPELDGDGLGPLEGTELGDTWAVTVRAELGRGDTDAARTALDELRAADAKHPQLAELELEVGS